jgi:thioredoxin reductase (NADPH)
MLMGGVSGNSRSPDGPFSFTIDGGDEVRARVALAAPGMDWRLDVNEIDELIDRGVYSAGRSEAANCGDDDVIVAGAGNTAGQAAMHLADATARVTMVVRGDRRTVEPAPPALRRR